jgi:hypothetical protein
MCYYHHQLYRTNLHMCRTYFWIQVFVAALVVLFRRNGIRTSCITITFWFVLVVCDLPHYLSQVEMAKKSVSIILRMVQLLLCPCFSRNLPSIVFNYFQRNNIRLYPYISNVIYFPVILSMLLLELFVDARPIQSLYPPLKVSSCRLLALF